MNISAIAVVVLAIAVIVSALAQNWFASFLLLLALVGQASLWYREWKDR